MSFTWKDGLATILVGITGVIAYAKIKGFEWPLLSSWRLGTMLLLFVGLGACITIGSGAVPVKNAWTTVASVIGGLGFLFALIGLIFNSKLAFILFATDIMTLWFITTLHHAITTSP